MIRQLQNRSKSAQKSRRHIFVAFQNERDSLGRIIRPRISKKNDYNIMELFQNLKKSTKEYFFEKQFQKMQKKFENVKKNIEHDKNVDYDKQVQKCMKIASKLMDNKVQAEKNKENLYINLRQKINNKINGVTSGLKKIKKSQVRCQQFQKPSFILKDIEQQQPKSINVELFKSFSARSELMATFCERGLKYASFVEEKKFDPWKTWYKKNELQLFPGKKIQVKCLQKSIFQ